MATLTPEIRPDQLYRKAEGGLASLGESLAAQGRGGDSMMVHMAPEEVAGLRSLAMQQGTDLTINPVTGMPEAFKLKKLFRALAPMLPFLIPGVGTALAAFGAKAGLGALASKAIASGVIGGFTAPGKGFNFKEGLKTGIMAFAGGKLAEGLQAAGQTAGTTGPAPSTGPIYSGSGGVSIGMEPSLYATGAPSATVMGPAGAEIASSVPSTVPVMEPAIDIRSLQSSGPALSDPFSTVQPPSTGPNVSLQGAKDAFTGAGNLLSGSPEASAAFTEAVGVAPTTAALIGTTGYGMLEGDKEREAFKAAQAAQQREDEKRRQEYLALFNRTLGAVPMPTYGAAGGGLVALAKGGMPTFEYGGTTGPTNEPRMVKGAGDGMSDNVPASIEGVQEARLANDEFVIPADVVADIGNGSSSSGAKKLYAMMDRIRQARHGTNEQPPEIDAEALMPA